MKKSHLPRRSLTIIAFPAIALVLAACGGESEITPTPTATPETYAVSGELAPNQTESEGAPDPQTTTPVALAPAACLLGTWELDNDTYLEYLRAVSANGDETGWWESVDGILRVTLDAEGVVTNETDGFAITLCSPDDCLTVPVEQQGAAPYAVDGDRLAVAGGSLFVTATIDSSLGEYSETVVTEDETARFVCSGNLLTFFPNEESPEIRFHRTME